MSTSTCGSFVFRVGKGPQQIVRVATLCRVDGTKSHARGKKARTLRRHPEHERRTFGQILDDSRCGTAVAYFSDSRLAVFVIAGRLGYTEPSTSFCAFRRGTGTLRRGTGVASLRRNRDRGVRYARRCRE